MSVVCILVVRISWFIIYLELVALGAGCFVYVESNAAVDGVQASEWSVIFSTTKVILGLCILQIGIFVRARREMKQTTGCRSGCGMTGVIAIARILAVLICQFSLFLVAFLLRAR